MGPGSAEQRCALHRVRDTIVLSGTVTRFHRYQFRSTPDQFQFIFDAKCRLNLYAFA
jgi:hypothetical protein